MNLRPTYLFCFLLLLGLAGCSNKEQGKTQGKGSPEDGIDRTVLPIHEPGRKAYSELDVRNTEAPPRFQVKAPKDAPNVLVVLIDDMGYGVTSPFGGPVAMPTMEKLSQNGLRYTRFHTTALCAPTRTALLTGYNHHSNNMGVITEFASTYPGYNAVRPQSITPMAEVLRQNGFSTAQFGKCHEVPPWELSGNGPFDRWPTHSGFEKFYGFLGGETNQWAPMVYDGVTMVETPKDPNYHFTTDMANHAISWVQQQQSLQPDKPFFMYFAPGATHAPHHAPKSFVDKYKGKFDQGWDKIREATLARQKQMGIIPENTQLAPKPKEIKDWDALSADEKKLFSRQMEVYAGFAEHTDYEIGRVISAIEEMGELDNTIIVFIAGDNGSSAEGQMNGMYNEMTYFNQVPETVPDMLKHYSEWGSPATYPHFSAGWAVATDVPFSWTKQVASDFGGTRNGMIVHWPKGIQAKGELRNQFGHVIDIAPTIFELTGIPSPKMVNGIAQDPIEGKSLAYSFANPKAPEQHETQYFEIFGNRGIYHQGWFARTIHRAPYEYKPRQTLQQDPWELYNTLEDFSCSKNLAAEHPEKLKELQALFMKEGEKYHVLPIDDRTIERMSATEIGRPTLMEGRTSMTLVEGMHGLATDVFIDLRGKSFTMEAQLESGAKANGVIVCQGGQFGGISFYVKDGKPVFTYNFLGLQSTNIVSKEALKPGKNKVVFEFTYDGGGPAKGGNGRLLINGNVVAEGRIPRTQPGLFSVDDLADVGMDEGTPVAAYGNSSHFNGKIHKVVITQK